MAIYNVPNQLQPKWPLRIDDTFGPYASVANVQESIKQDFVFLLKTVQGEWPNRPDLGIGLPTYLFETYGSEELSNIRYKIAEQLKKYLPIVSLGSAEFVSTENDQDNLSTVLRISYTIRNLNATDTLEINLTKVEPSEVYIGDLNSEIAKMGGFE